MIDKINLRRLHLVEPFEDKTTEIIEKKFNDCEKEN
jgi:hypothetical protein